MTEPKGAYVTWWRTEAGQRQHAVRTGALPVAVCGTHVKYGRVTDDPRCSRCVAALRKNVCQECGQEVASDELHTYSHCEVWRESLLRAAHSADSGTS